MLQRILLITGWGGGIKLLDPLKQLLQGQGHQVELINIFNALDEQILQQQVDLAKQFDVIVGWSLGGQLATLLVNQLEKQYAQQKVLITLASNPCFVVNDSWQTAMDRLTFQQFKQSFEQDAIATLKKFGYMVCQGMKSTKSDFLLLQSLIQPQQIQLLKQGLNLLEQLNVADILKSYQGKQYHLFAQQDNLVSCKVVENLGNFHAKFLEVDLISGSHGFPIFNAEETNDKICQYLKKIKQTS
ncbi:hydrolase [Acinetobacter sp. ANC 4779]|uniref:YqiA/YcfP family alpha/beta fold hydrolase n=1 Tax=Acinetobacter sp. ANC 4779 TaxID=2529848 RepID=UPI001040BE6F|nr:YqiA/YcfP family alpha/beta fold hydrolase [Acinetobacter sp. ANC 4779]TCB49607.1 hydrolase [Acinetobacter sp. ANC 4779]